MLPLASDPFVPACLLYGHEWVEGGNNREEKNIMNEGYLQEMALNNLPRTIATISVEICANGYAVSVYNQRQYVFLTFDEALAKVKELFEINDPHAGVV